MTWHAKAGKWAAQVKVAGKVHYLGLHPAREEAEIAVSEFRARNPSHRAKAVIRQTQSRENV
ncbi:hypothetical protein ACFXJ8_14315 [Nonomuraea sp. NPDC059194]|uniref:hypothetical protein n=1 Tax=Nonomuraea sp. NPDC059194 TaxID=3346764 RepID=UPI00367DAB9E